MTPIQSAAPGLSWFAHVGAVDEVPIWAVPVFLVLCVFGGLALWRGIPPVVAALAGIALLMVLATAFAHDGDRDLSRSVAATQLADDRGWVDARVGDDDVALVIPATANLSIARSLVVWNSSIEEIYGGEGRRWRMPQPVRVLEDGERLPLGSQIRWLVAPVGYVIDAPVIETEPKTGLVLHRISGQTTHLASVAGRANDGWVGEQASVRRAIEGPAGVAEIDVSTTNPFVLSARTVSYRVGAKSGQVVVPPGVSRTLRIPVPAGAWDLRLEFSPAPSPADTGGGDTRNLSLVVGAIRLPGVEQPL